MWLQEVKKKVAAELSRHPQDPLHTIDADNIRLFRYFAGTSQYLSLSFVFESSSSICTTIAMRSSYARQVLRRKSSTRTKCPSITTSSIRRTRYGSTSTKGPLPLRLVRALEVQLHCSDPSLPLAAATAIITRTLSLHGRCRYQCRFTATCNCDSSAADHRMAVGASGGDQENVTANGQLSTGFISSLSKGMIFTCHVLRTSLVSQSTLHDPYHYDPRLQFLHSPDTSQIIRCPPRLLLRPTQLPPFQQSPPPLPPRLPRPPLLLPTRRQPPLLTIPRRPPPPPPPPTTTMSTDARVPRRAAQVPGSSPHEALTHSIP